MTTHTVPRFINTACTHPRVTHAHGTYVCYTIDRCRCDLCMCAQRMYMRAQQRDHHFAKYNPNQYARLVPAAPARTHVENLQAAGLGWKRIARLAGVSDSAVYPLLWGRPDRNNHAPHEVIQRRTAIKLLAVPLPGLEDLAPGRYIDATPSTNRVRALATIGYTFPRIASLIDRDLQVVWGLAAGNHPSTTVRTALAVRALFAARWDKPVAGSTPHECSAVTRIRKQARRERWPSPLDLDDDGLVEVPEDDAPLDVDSIAVRRVLEGDRPDHLTSSEVDEVIRVGAAEGLGFGRLAVLLRMSHDAVQQRARRAGIRSEWVA